MAAHPARAAFPALAALPPPPNLTGAVHQAEEAIRRAAVVVVNTTAVRNLLDALAPPSSLPNSTAIRLLGAPPSYIVAGGTPGTVLSPDGTQLYQITAPVVRSGLFSRTDSPYSILTVIDTDSNSVVGQVRIGGEVQYPPVVSPDGTRVYVTSTVWSHGEAKTTYVTSVDTSTTAVIGTPVALAGWAPGNPVLSSDGGRLYQVTSGGGFNQTVTAIDTASGAIVGTPVTLSGGSVVGALMVSSDGSRLSLTTQSPNKGDGQPQTAYVSVIDAADTSLINRVTLIGSAAGGIVVNPDATTAAQAVSVGTTTTIISVDLADGSVAWTATADGSASYSAYAPMFSDNGSRVSLVTVKNSSPQVTVFDSSDGHVVGTLTLPGVVTGETTALVPDPAGDRLFVAAGGYYGPTWVTVVDTSDGTAVGDSISVPGFGRLVASADGASVYVPTTESLAVIDRDGTVTGTAEMPAGVIGVLVGPGDGRVYVETTNNERPQLVALDAVTAAPVGRPVTLHGSAPAGLLLSPDGTTIYDTTMPNSAHATLLSLLTSVYVTRVTVLDTAAMS
ncbi:YncE family protein [Mycolicibacterium sp. CBM1]